MDTRSASMGRGRQKALTGQTRFCVLALVCGTLVWAVAMVVLQWLRFRSNFHYEYEDAALYHQMLSAVGRGELFTNTIHPLHRPTHLPLVLVPLWPIHALLGGGWIGLFAIKALVIGAGSGAVFLLGRTLGLAPWASVGWGGIYLLFPPTIALVLGEFRPLALSVTPLLFLLWAFRARRLGTFIGLLLLTLSFREDLALATLPLAVVALIRRYDRRWAIAIAGISITWFLLATQLVLPHLLPRGWADIVIASNVDSGGILGVLANAFERSHVVGILAILVPVLLLPFGAWESTVGLMSVAGIMLHKGGFSGNLVHYIGPATAAAIGGALITYSGLRSRWPRLQHAVFAAVLLSHLNPLIPPVVAGSAEHNPVGDPNSDLAGAWTPFHPRFYRGDGHAGARRHAVGRVPADAPAAAVGHLLPMLSPRPILYEYGHRDTDFGSVDWLILEGRNLCGGAGAYLALTPEDVARQLAILSCCFEVVSATDGVIVLHRRRPSPPDLTDRLRRSLPSRDVPESMRRGSRSPGEDRVPHLRPGPDQRGRRGEGRRPD